MLIKKPKTVTNSYFQKITLDFEGKIIESVGTLLHTEGGASALEMSDFLASIFPILSDLQYMDTEIAFPQVASVTNSLEGFFDCTFAKTTLKNGENALLWTIFDQQKKYLKKQKQQQINNDKAIAAELAAIALSRP